LLNTHKTSKKRIVFIIFYKRLPVSENKKGGVYFNLTSLNQDLNLSTNRYKQPCQDITGRMAIDSSAFPVSARGYLCVITGFKSIIPVLMKVKAKEHSLNKSALTP